MKRSVQLIMLTISALTGCSVLTGTAGVSVLPKAPPRTEELLSNSGFEAPAIKLGTQAAFRPAGWLTFTSGTPDLILLCSTAAHAGNQVVKFVSHGVPNFYQGLYQRLPVTPGETYQFSVYVKSDSTNLLKGSVIGQLSIEWHDANDNELGRTWSTTWGASLPAKEWTRFEVIGAAPAETSKAHFVVVEKGEGEPVAGCIFLLDDASVVKVMDP